MQKRSSFTVLTDYIALDGIPFRRSGIFHQKDREIIYLHVHNADEIGLCLSGSGMFMIDHHPLSFQAHDILYIPRGIPHLAKSLHGTESTWIWFYADFQKLLQPHFPSFDFTLFSGGKPVQYCISHLDPDFSTIMNLMSKAAPDSEEETASVCMLFLLRLKKYLSPESGEGGIFTQNEEERLQKALLYFSNGFRRKVSLEKAARLCGMSPVHFRRTFKKMTGLPPLPYLHTLRITMAKASLRNSRSSVEEIALQCGYQDISTFNRQFHALVGMTPREYRKNGK